MDRLGLVLQGESLTRHGADLDPTRVDAQRLLRPSVPVLQPAHGRERRVDPLGQLPHASADQHFLTHPSCIERGRGLVLRELQAPR